MLIAREFPFKSGGRRDNRLHFARSSGISFGSITPAERCIDKSNHQRDAGDGRNRNAPADPVGTG